MTGTLQLPFTNVESWVVLIAALLFNLIVCRHSAVSRALTTPIALSARAIDILERRYNRPELTDAMRKVEGISSMIILVVIALIAGLVIDWFLGNAPYGWVLDAILLGATIQFRAHMDQSRNLGDALERSIEEGRAVLALFTARDTTDYDEPAVARGAIEATARALPDGVIGPLFWYALFGLPGLFIFKIVNLSFHMIDEQTDFAACFGWAPTRLNQWLIWPVDRISGVIGSFAAAFVPGGHLAQAFRTTFTMRKLSPLTQGSWPAAAFAGALNVKLGGPVSYHRRVVDARWFGDGSQMADSTYIRKARLLFAVSSTIFLLCLLGIAFFLPIPLFSMRHIPFPF